MSTPLAIFASVYALAGRERFEVFVGAAVLANNLLRIATLLPQHVGRRCAA